MRLTEEQKECALACRHGSGLVRVGDQWGLIWKDQTAPIAERWHAQLIYSVDFAGHETRVWWAGSEIICSQRQAVMLALAAEAGC